MVSVTMYSMSAVSPTIFAWRASAWPPAPKWFRTRLRRELAFPTYSTRRSAARNRYTPGEVGMCRRMARTWADGAGRGH